MSNAVIGALRVTMGLDSAAFTEGLSRAQKHLRDVGGRMERIGGQMKTLGAGMSLALTAPIVAFGVTSMKAAGDFEQAMNRVQAVSGATADEFAALRKQARDLGAATQFSASEAADAMGFLSMAGMKANDILAAMPKTLELAASAQLDMGRAADIVTNIMAGYGLGVEELGRANDVLVKSFTSANTDLSQLAEAMKYAGPVASAAGVQFEEAAAALSLMGNAGIQGSMAGTSLRGAISRILSPTKAMSKAMAAAGLDFTDAQGRLLPLVDIIRALEPHAADAGLFMTLFGQRAGPAMAALVSQGADAVKSLTGELVNSAGTASEIAAVQMRGFNGSMRELKSAFEELQLAVADSGILDMLQGLAVKMAGFIRSIAAVNPKLLAIGVAVAAAAAAIGPLIFAAGALTASIGVMLPMLGAIAPFILPVVAAVAGLTVAFLAFKDKIIPAAKAFYSTLKETVGPKLQPLFDALKSAFSAVGEVFNAIFGKESGSTEGLEMFGRIVARVFGAVVDLITGALNVITNILRAFAALLRGDFSGMWNALGSAVKAVVTAVLKAFETLFPGVTASVRKMYEGVKAWLQDKLFGVLRGVISRVQAVSDAFFKLYDAVVGHSYVPDMVTEVGQWMAKLDDNMVKPAVRATRTAAEAFEEMQQRVQRAMGALMTDRERLDLDFRTDTKELNALLAAGPRKGGIDQKQFDELKARLDATYRRNSAGLDAKDLTLPTAPDLTSVDRLPGVQAINDTWERIQQQIHDSRERFAESFEYGINAALRGDWQGVLQALFGDAMRKGLLDIGRSLFDSFSRSGGGGGGLGGILSSAMKFLPGFARGGSFQVGGSGSVDSKLVAFRATPGERVDISTVRQQRQGGGASVVHVAPSPYFDVRVEELAAPLAAQAGMAAVEFGQRQQASIRHRQRQNLIYGR